MTQRVFDVENEKDMQDLWGILQDHIIKIVKPFMTGYLYPKYVLARSEDGEYELPIDVNWRNKTEITRPIQEATKQDIGKICAFWDKDIKDVFYGKLVKIHNGFAPHVYQASGERGFVHCRRLTKQEIEELC